MSSLSLLRRKIIKVFRNRVEKTAILLDPCSLGLKFIVTTHNAYHLIKLSCIPNLTILSSPVTRSPDNPLVQMSCVQLNIPQANIKIVSDISFF